jgi:hypothetical protein
MAVNSCHVRPNTIRWILKQNLNYSKKAGVIKMLARDRSLMPEELLRLIKRAKNNGCWWLVIDDNGPILDYFQSQWDDYYA